MKLNLSIMDRSAAIQLIPTTGSLKEVKDFKKWEHELKLTDKERQIERSIANERDKDKKDKALNEFYHTINEIELSDELVAFLHKKAVERDNSHNISVGDSTNLYDELFKLQ